MATKAKEKEKNQQDHERQLEPPDAELVFHERIADIQRQVCEKYDDWSAEQLHTALSEMRQKARALRDWLAGAEDLLDEAAKKDEREFLTAGVEASLEAPNYTAAQREVATKALQHRACERLAVELECAWALATTADCLTEMQERHPRIEEAEEMVKKAEEHRQELWGQQRDTSLQKDDAQRLWSKRSAELLQHLDAPAPRGMLAFLSQTPDKRS